jgi:hypothetical protein
MKLNSLSLFQTNNVERDFLASINRAFSRFGYNRVDVVLHKFEDDYHLSRKDIFDHPELFSRTVQKIFRFGASYVEKAMISELIEEFSLAEGDYRELSDIVRAIKKSEIDLVH